MQTGKHLLRTQNLCPQQMLRARTNGETFVSATMCRQQCVRNNVSSFASTLTQRNAAARFLNVQGTRVSFNASASVIKTNFFGWSENSCVGKQAENMQIDTFSRLLQHRLVIDKASLFNCYQDYLIVLKAI